MRGAFLLLWLSLKRARTLLLATGLLLMAFQVMLVLIARSIEHAGEFEQIAALLPPFARAILGPSVASVLSFRGIVCVGYFDLGIVIALLALVIALATAGVNVLALVAGVSVVGVGVGLAIQGVLSILVAGLSIIFS